jgi:ABC-type Fe3+ transport system permease subunit
MGVLRSLVVLVTGFLAGSRLVAVGISWKAWRAYKADSRAADALYHTFLSDLTIAVLSLVIAGLVAWLLRPAARRGSLP